MEKEVCWNITTRCNQACKYCHKFLNLNDLSLSDNLKILNNIHNSGINNITWTGGEALIYDGIDELIKVAFDYKIKSKLITNSKLLDEDRLNRIIPYLNNITLSLDSVDEDTNSDLGRGKDHFSGVDWVLKYIKKNNINIKISINTVISKMNSDKLDELSKYLNNFNIDSWRLFKFMPLRELALKNNQIFQIDEDRYFQIVDYIKLKSNINNIEYRVEKDMEKKYLLIVADGSVMVTDNGVDKIIGNALIDSFEKFL